MTEEHTLSTVVLVRLASEVTIKSKRTRSTFLRQLRKNLRDALDSTHAPFSVDGQWSRLYVRAASAEALSVLPRVFGVSSISPIEARVSPDLDEIVAAGLERYRDHVAGRKFAVRAHRVGVHAFTSKDIEIALGAALLPHSAGVNLSAPEVTVHVEVREKEAYLFTERIRAEGGLPLGVEGKAVALLSGGYDSAVSAWLMLKRGIALDYVFCNLGGDAYERSVVQVAKVLAEDWSYGTRPRLHVVDFGEPLRELREKTRGSYWQLLLKRLMYRVASRIGAQIRAEAIITGEAVGQVSSQTLTNLRAIEPAADLPLFRPLLGFDKEEIIARAQHIGTAALSEQVKEYCAIAPGHPVTAASVARVDEQEALLDLGVLDDVIANRKVLDLRALQPADLISPYLFATEVPQESVVFDVRPLSQFRAWHLPGAQQRDELDLLQNFRKLDKEPKYVLYCAHGIQTAYIAERMQRAGYEAYSFKGGLRGVLEYARSRGIPTFGLK